MPFVYAGFTIFGLIIDYNHKNYIEGRNNLYYINDDDPLNDYILIDQ